MKQDQFDRAHRILYLFGALLAVWLALLVAPAFGGGLAGFLENAGELFEHPFRIHLCEDSPKVVLAFLVIYGMAVGVYLSNDRNYRRREEHGSAKWGSPAQVNKKYANREKTENKILTRNVSIGLDGRTHRRNLNILVCGGSGAGKTRFFAKPNVMNACTSYVCLDPKGCINYIGE